jgi:tRNA(Ile)-lysidine synthase
LADLPATLGAFFNRHPDLQSAKSLAVAVSGGADSLALCHALSINHPLVHAIVVDHGLRAESAAEAAGVCATIAAKTKAIPLLQCWDGDKPASKIQEEARAARYEILAQACTALDTPFLFLGHHADDQAETVLMRLAAGSGLDGLCAMRDRADKPGLTLLRPFLGLSHADLVAYCDRHDLPYVDDPSNANPAYQRVRLRAAQDVLAAEGLTAQRLGATARRLQRAHDALTALTLALWQDHAVVDGQACTLPLSLLLDVPEDIAIRLVLKAAQISAPDRAYPVKLDVVEKILPELLHSDRKTSRTVGGLLLTSAPKQNTLEIRPES